MRGAESAHVAEPPEATGDSLSGNQRLQLVVCPLLRQATLCVSLLQMVLSHPDLRLTMTAQPPSEGLAPAGTSFSSR